jgi:hypothetical protein
VAAADRPYVMRLRRLANFATVLSLALCVAATVCWARSFWTADAPDLQVRRSAGSNVFDRHIRIASVCGRLALSFTEGEFTHDPAKVKFDFPDHVGFAWEHGPSYRIPGSFFDQFRVVRIGSGWRTVRSGRSRRIGLMLPYALPVALLAVLPLEWWRRRRKLHPPGHCTQCGYDLRGTPSRCPECGTVTGAARPPHNPPLQRPAAAA